jgi:hypothetical protein
MKFLSVCSGIEAASCAWNPLGWNRVAYEAERARVLLGERTSEPCILQYGEDVATPAEWTGSDPESMGGITQGGKV